MRYLSLILTLTLFAGAASADNGNNFKWIREIRYEQIRPYNDGLSAFMQNGKWGFINEDGKVTIEPMYDDCKDFSNGVAAVKVENKWGYINASGQMIIKPRFEDCTSFHNNLATAKEFGSQWGVISKTGKSVAGFIFDSIGKFENGFAYAESMGTPYYIRTNGQAQKLSKEFSYGHFTEGMAPLMHKKKHKWGFINTKGKIVIDPIYDTVSNFSNGIAFVKRKGEKFYINQKGGKKSLVLPSAQELNFINGLAKVTKGNGVGFMNSNFEVLPVYAKSATDFNENGTAVIILFDNKIQYIDKTGKVLAAGDYDRVGNFNDGLAWVSKNDKFGYINTQGKMVIDTIFTSATDFKDGVAFVQHNGRLGSIKYQTGAVMPELQITEVSLKDNNSNNKVEAEEKFTMAVTISNPSNEDLNEISVQFANLVDQEKWFEFEDHVINISSLKAQSDTVINFSGISNVSLISEDINVRFRGSASNMFTSTEHEWSFEALGINACKPVITRYWIYKDNHTPIRQGDKVNVKLTVKNDGKDLAKNVKVDFQWPEGIQSAEQSLSIASMKPGETRDMNTTFTIDTLLMNDLTIVAKISDFTQMHNKVEYLSFMAGRMNAEVSLEGGAAPMRFQYGPDNQSLAGNFNSTGTTQLVTMEGNQTQELAVEEKFVSELLQDMVESSTPDHNKFALVIGNEDYNTFKQTTSYEVNVDYAVADAEAFAEYATHYMGVPKQNVILLKNATFSQMRFNINKLTGMSKSDPGNIELYVFYAGHGQHDVESKETYLIPVDVSISTPTAGLKLDDVYATLGESKAKRTMVFMDACYSGQGRGIVIKPKETPVNGNVLVFTATSSSQRSMPYKEKQHGMFTYYLLKTIKENGGKMSVTDLFNSVKRDVVRNSMWINNSEQTPELINGSGIDNGWESWMLD